MAEPVTARERYPERARAGLALVGVLLLTTLMVAITLGLSRHVVLAVDASAHSARTRTMGSLAGSGLVHARQTLRADAARLTTLTMTAGGQLSIDVVNTSDERRSITVQAEEGGRTQTSTAEADVFLSGGDALPTLTAAARLAVLADASLVDVGRDLSYADQRIDCILLLRAGVTLTLQDVELVGCILDESVLWDAPRSASASSHVVVSGGLLIEPGTTLPGCAILAPDTDLSGSVRAQVDGVMVLHELSLAGTGPVTLLGDVLTRLAWTSPPGTEQPGAGRAPRVAPTVLTAGSQVIDRLMFPSPIPTTGERQDIMSFAFEPIASEGMEEVVR